MIVVGSKYQLTAYTIMMVGCMSVDEIFNSVDFSVINTVKEKIEEVD